MTRLQERLETCAKMISDRLPLRLGKTYRIVLQVTDKLPSGQELSLSELNIFLNDLLEQKMLAAGYTISVLYSKEQKYGK